MSTVIDRHQVQMLAADGAQLVEVLPGEEYAEGHIQGAINLHLKKLNRDTAAQLDRSRPVITYCHDYE
jgi:rhodanese-related sulfurtransferase